VAKFPGRTDFGHWMPCAQTFLDTLAKRSLKMHQHLASRLRFGLVGPRLFATSSRRVIFSVTMPYFRHIEDMHDFGPYDAFLSSDVPEMVD
jgi:hypothetical protein